MSDGDREALLARVEKLEAELAVHRGALVWLMGVHQLGPDDRNPQLAVLEPLGLDLRFKRLRRGEATPDEIRAADAAKNFVEAARRVFIARQLSPST